MGGRDVAAEDDRIETIRHKLTQVSGEQLQLGVTGLAGKLFGLGNKTHESRLVVAGEGLDVILRERIRTTVEDLVQEGLRILGLFQPGTGAEGLRRRSRARGYAAHEGQRSPEAEPRAVLVSGCRVDNGGAVVENPVKQLLPTAGELVGQLLRLPAGKEVALLPLGDVGSAALHEVTRETLAELESLLAGRLGEPAKVAVEETEQPEEGGFVTAMRGGGEEHQMAGRRFGKAAEQLVALVATRARRGTGVRLVDDHELGAGAQEVGAAAVALDVVEADHGMRVRREDTFGGRQIAFEPAGARRGDADRADVEVRLQLAEPLINEVRRTENGSALDIATVEELARDERRLDGLADADVVGDQQAHRIELERHQERHELVGARLDGDLTGTSERARAAAEREEQGVAQEECRVVAGALGHTRPRKARRSHRLGLQREVDECSVFLRAGNGSHAERLGVAAREHDPLPTAGAD